MWTTPQGGLFDGAHTVSWSLGTLGPGATVRVCVPRSLDRS